MPRKTIQKRFTTTVVHGVELNDDKQLVEVEYRINGNRNEKTAQALIRRDNPNFTLTSIEHDSSLYIMDYDTFIANAEKVEE